MMLLLVPLLFVGTLGFAPSRTSTDLRIVGGKPAAVGQFPYQVSIRRYGKHGCGGSIINANTILTAAGCVQDILADNLVVAAGTNLISGDGELYNVATYSKHTFYNPVDNTNDVALLHLTSKIQFSDLVQPITLDSKVIDGYVGCVLSGWGRTTPIGSYSEQLQYLNLFTILNSECIQKHSTSNFPITSTNICTYTEPGQGACKGDFGGPLVSSQKQIGIASWGRPCGVGYPDVFSRVSSYYKWINDNK